MINNYSDIELFDRYSGNLLTVEERAIFEERLANDKAFNEEFEFYQSITLGIKDYGNAELKDYLKEHGHALTSSKNKNKTITWSIAAAMAIFLGVYVVSQFYSNQKAEQSISVIQPEADESLTTDTITTGQNNENNKGVFADGNSQLSEVPKEEIIEEPVEFKNAEAAPSTTEDLQRAGKYYWSFGDDADIPVKTDKKLSDSVVLIVALTGPLDSEKDEEIALAKTSQGATQLPKSLNNNTYSNNTYDYKTTTVKKKSILKADAPKADDVEKTIENKLADTTALANTAKPESIATQYTLEFWESPVNFKGYKLTGTTVQLYGTANKNIRLFNVNQQLYLRIDKVVYVLKPCSTGCALTLETDPTIKNYILQQP
ncbi:MAG: hypothetical protein V4613_09810 [Bacteroidota bacterium]